MSKKPNLAAIAEAAGSTRRQPPAQDATPVPETAKSKPRTRQATRQIAAHFPAEVAWQLRELAVARRSTVQALMAEALNDLFRKYDKPELAPVQQGRGV